MKIAIVTNIQYQDMPKWVGYTQEAKKRYCAHRKIEYVFNYDNPHPELHPVWAKPSVLLSVIDSYDYVVWMDADAMPVNLGFDLESYLATTGDHVVMCKDINGWNAGVFSVPNTDNGHAWLGHVEAYCHDPRYQTGYMEQQCMADSFATVWKSFAQEPPRDIGWNTYPDIHSYHNVRNPYTDGAWCIHFAGVPEAARGYLIKNFYKRACK